MRTSRWRGWLIAAGFLALLLITIAVMLGPATPEDRVAYAPKPDWPVMRVAKAEPEAPVASAVMANTGEESTAVRWREAYRRNHSLTLRQRVHQARVSGALEDIVAAYAMANHCMEQGLRAAPPPADTASDFVLAYGRLTERQRTLVPAFQARCEGAHEARRAEFRLLSTDHDAEVAALLIRAVRGKPMKPEDRDPLMRFAQSQGSATLLAAVVRSLWEVQMDWIGWPTGSPVEGLANGVLLQKALALAACQEQGNCEQVALENYSCIDFIGCVDDERQWAGRFLWSDPSQRGALFQPYSAEDLARGLEALERKLLALGLSPAEFRALRQGFLPGCRTTACLQQRWAEAQAFVAALISGAHKPGQPWPP